MRDLVVDGLHKTLGTNHVLKGVSLALEPGEVVALLGPSGSGKTTILRAVAGLETPDRGHIAVRDRVVFDGAAGTDMPPEGRGLGMVFQSYALWPNRTVFENVAYTLKLRKEGAEAVRSQVTRVLDQLGLGALGERYPHQLSGGQQQRVALARALVYQPPVLLLDEPLSNLDAKLREEARSWLRQVITGSRLSALYVTHDQVEAMAVADRLLLLNEGTVEQEGTPQEIYEHPRSALAANFMGSTNRLDGTIGEIRGDQARLDLPGGAGLWGRHNGIDRPGMAATGFIRIERTRLADGPGAQRLPLALQAALYLGERWEYLLTGNGQTLRAWGDAPLPTGERWIELPADRFWIFPAQATE